MSVCGSVSRVNVSTVLLELSSFWINAFRYDWWEIITMVWGYNLISLKNKTGDVMCWVILDFGNNFITWILIKRIKNNPARIACLLHGLIVTSLIEVSYIGCIANVLIRQTKCCFILHQNVIINISFILHWCKGKRSNWMIQLGVLLLSHRKLFDPKP